MKKNKLIVISADAMVSEDLEYFKTLPNYKKYLANGCEIKQVKSVYPTITYTCHTTMSTGVYPQKHGVTGNYQFLPGQSPLPWKWDYSNNHWKEDIFTVAKKAGYSTAAVMWPVSGNHPAIDLLIAEYWPQGSGDTPRDAYSRMGSKEKTLEIVENHFGENAFEGHPQVEHFTVSCTCEMIRRYQPDLTMIHLANIDSYRHANGAFHEKIRQGIEETDMWIGEIMQAVEDAGVLEETNLVLTSDHGQLDVKRIINLNVIFADYGLMSINKDGTLQDWNAYILSNAMSALVYLKDPEDKALWNRVYDLLKQMETEGIYGIGKVFTLQEVIEQYKTADGFSFMLETDGYTSFGDSWTRPIVKEYDFTDYRSGKATHGYLPEKGPQPMFLAKGPGFKENVTLEKGLLVDQAPTYAALLGIALQNADGKPLYEFLKCM